MNKHVWDVTEQNKGRYDEPWQQIIFSHYGTLNTTESLSRRPQCDDYIGVSEHSKNNIQNTNHIQRYSNVFACVLIFSDASSDSQT